MFGLDSIFSAGVDLFQSERQLDRDADAADTAWRRGQENLGISNAFSAAEAEKARAFNERMSASAHQREVNDLKAAGLNPMLSVNRGSSAAGPAASSASANAPTQAAAPKGSGIASAMALKRLNVETENTEMDTDLKRSDRNLRQVDYNVRLKDQDLRNQQIKTEEENTRAAKANAEILESSAVGKAREEEIDRGDWGAFFRYLDRLRGSAGAYRDIRPR